MKATFYALNGMGKTAIDAEGVLLKTDDGQEVELWFRRSDGHISVTTRKSIIVYPRASNVVYIKDSGTI